MDLSNILQESIINVSPQIFLNRLVFFNLISHKENETLQNSITWEKQQKSTDISTITTFMVQKLKSKTAVYHERFKIFLGYYTDLKSFYRNWDTIGKILSVNRDLFLFAPHFLLLIRGCSETPAV